MFWQYILETQVVPTIICILSNHLIDLFCLVWASLYIVIPPFWILKYSTSHTVKPNQVSTHYRVGLTYFPSISLLKY